jgi:hypothetical protein
MQKLFIIPLIAGLTVTVTAVAPPVVTPVVSPVEAVVTPVVSPVKAVVNRQFLINNSRRAGSGRRAQAKQVGIATMGKTFVSGHPSRPNIPQGATVTVRGSAQVLGANGRYFTVVLIRYQGHDYQVTPDYLAY